MPIQPKPTGAISSSLIASDLIASDLIASDLIASGPIASNPISKADSCCGQPNPTSCSDKSQTP
jgi:hypothetical protein